MSGQGQGYGGGYGQSYGMGGGYGGGYGNSYGSPFGQMGYGGYQSPYGMSGMQQQQQYAPGWGQGGWGGYRGGNGWGQGGNPYAAMFGNMYGGFQQASQQQPPQAPVDTSGAPQAPSGVDTSGAPIGSANYAGADTGNMAGPMGLKTQQLAQSPMGYTYNAMGQLIPAAYNTLTGPRQTMPIR